MAGGMRHGSGPTSKWTAWHPHVKQPPMPHTCMASHIALPHTLMAPTHVDHTPPCRTHARMSSPHLMEWVGCTNRRKQTEDLPGSTPCQLQITSKARTYACYCCKDWEYSILEGKRGGCDKVGERERENCASTCAWTSSGI